MVEINLLPAELRPSTQTPKPRFATILVGIMGLGLLLVWYIRITTIEIAKLEQSKQEVQGIITSRRPQEIEFNKLTKEKAAFALRQKTVQSLVESRTPIELFLDQLCDLLSPTNVWIENLTLQKPAASRGRATGSPKHSQSQGTPVLTVSMSCKIEAPQEEVLKKVAEFHESFKESDYFSKYLIPPVFSGITVGENQGSFRISSTLIKPPEDSDKKKLGTAPRTGAQ